MLNDYTLYVGVDDLLSIDLSVSVKRSIEKVVQPEISYTIKPAYDITLMKISSPINVSLFNTFTAWDWWRESCYTKIIL